MADRRRTLAGLVLAALSLCLGSLAAAPPADPNAAIVAALTKQADAWDKAIVKKDRAAVAANIADDFRNIDAAGTVAGKAAFVDGLMDPKLEIDPYTVDDFDVRVLGDTALLCGRTRMTGRYDGKPFTSHYRYIDIYVKRNAAWKIVSVQITRMAP